MSGVSEENTSGLTIGNKKGDLLLFCDEVARSSEKDLKKVWQELECDHSWEEQLFFSKALANFKREKKLLDFTDMLDLFIEQKNVPHLDIIFVDEAQDLSPLQWKMFFYIEENCKRSYIAGDDDQTIYTFQGADQDIFINLKAIL